MTKKELIREVGKLGFDLIEKEESIDVNNIVFEIIKNKELRILEGFPIILANALKTGQFDYDKILNQFHDKKDKELFIGFIQLSFALYQFNHIDFKWKDIFYNSLSDKIKEKIKNYYYFLKENKSFMISDYNFSAERINKIFNNYNVNQEENSLKDLANKHKELSLEYALSQIFSPKQKNLFRKKLRGEKMTKTEREYYSRIIKKKIIALSNIELHNLARNILEM